MCAPDRWSVSHSTGEKKPQKDCIAGTHAVIGQELSVREIDRKIERERSERKRTERTEFLSCYATTSLSQSPSRSLSLSLWLTVQPSPLSLLSVFLSFFSLLSFILTSFSHLLTVSFTQRQAHSLSLCVGMRVGHRGDLRALLPLSLRCVCASDWERV